MTTITIGKYCIKVEGHSGYDEKGKDIVCAAISTLVEATYNYLLATDNDVENESEEDGLFIFRIKEHRNYAGERILESFKMMIYELAEQYPKYIQIMVLL